jgi:DNA-binding IclR family transcriptional regulator
MATSQVPSASEKGRRASAKADGAPSKGADRVLAVFKSLAQFPRGASLDQIAEEVGSPKSSTHRALATLRRAGLAEQTADGGYRMGLEALRLAFAYYENLDNRVLVQPALDELAHRFGETVHYAELDGGEVVYVAKVVQRDHGVHMASRIGGRNPAHCTGVGKMLLSYELPDAAAVADYVDAHGLERRTENTIVTAKALHAELETIRARGYSIDDEENETGVGCVALPVFIGPGPRPTGAASVTTLLHRTGLDVLVDGVDEMKAILGGHVRRAEG